ncbi:MAG TPA: alpha/beta hydrolase [Chitinophagaceae bacterium]|nr:alpha/beta hydrolase [Chitinophagaceae bacterium]
MDTIKKNLLAFLIFTSPITILHAQSQYSIKYGDNKEAGNFKKINGIDLYYEIYGTGKPLIFLHGSGGSIRGARAKIDYFKKYFKVIAIDSRAHGKSIDTTTKELTYVQMANDIKVLLDSLNIDSAFVSGQSDGGILGLLLAINFPAKISKLATFGANMFPGKEAIVDEIDNLIFDTLKVTKNFNTKRLYSLLAYQPNITEKDLQKIKCPVLIISGDRDAIKLEHSIKIFNNIANANLFVMPGATHFGSSEKPELFDLVLLDFLNRPFSKVTTFERFTGKY